MFRKIALLIMLGGVLTVFTACSNPALTQKDVDNTFNSPASQKILKSEQQSEQRIAALVGTMITKDFTTNIMADNKGLIAEKDIAYEDALGRMMLDRATEWGYPTIPQIQALIPTIKDDTASYLIDDVNNLSMKVRFKYVGGIWLIDSIVMPQ